MMPNLLASLPWARRPSQTGIAASPDDAESPRPPASPGRPAAQQPAPQLATHAQDRPCGLRSELEEETFLRFVLLLAQRSPDQMALLARRAVAMARMPDLALATARCSAEGEPTFSAVVANAARDSTSSRAPFSPPSNELASISPSSASLQSLSLSLSPPFVGAPAPGKDGAARRPPAARWQPPGADDALPASSGRGVAEPGAPLESVAPPPSEPVSYTHLTLPTKRRV